MTALACSACTGVAEYRVNTSGNHNDADNFDQVSDHRSPFFTSPMYLAGVADGKGQVTVWKLPAGYPKSTEPAEVIAYAGPDPTTGARTWWTTDETGQVVTA
jgi:hypothetical protein